MCAKFKTQRWVGDRTRDTRVSCDTREFKHCRDNVLNVCHARSLKHQIHSSLDIPLSPSSPSSNKIASALVFACETASRDISLHLAIFHYINWGIDRCLNFQKTDQPATSSLSPSDLVALTLCIARCKAGHQLSTVNSMPLGKGGEEATYARTLCISESLVRDQRDARTLVH